ncbi:MAG: PhzF family phenazine biosynthesis protein [Bacteroidota bacterium]
MKWSAPSASSAAIACFWSAISRCFYPQCGIDEDPTTGSAHTTMTPYWANRLEKEELTALQLSKRVGSLRCKYLGERVEISGNAQTFLVGEIFLP